MKRYCPALKELKIESRKENVLNRLRLRNQHRTILNEKKKKKCPNCEVFSAKRT